MQKLFVVFVFHFINLWILVNTEKQNKKKKQFSLYEDEGKSSNCRDLSWSRDVNICAFCHHLAESMGFGHHFPLLSHRDRSTLGELDPYSSRPPRIQSSAIKTKIMIINTCRLLLIMKEIYHLDQTVINVLTSLLSGRSLTTSAWLLPLLVISRLLDFQLASGLARGILGTAVGLCNSVLP